MTHCFDLAGDVLTLDRRPVASIAHLDPGFRALVREQITTMIDAHEEPDEPEPLDLTDLELVEVVLNDEGVIVGRFFPGPPLPDGWSTTKVVQFQVIAGKLKDARIEFKGPEE